jgi:hypothetical protein
MKLIYYIDTFIDSDALADFQPDFRRAVARLITAYLSNNYSTPRMTSVPQARWCMSAIGQVFALPFYADSSLMNDAADIYSKWLLERNARPECYRGVGTDETEEGYRSQQFLQVSQSIKMYLYFYLIDYSIYYDIDIISTFIATV